MSVRVFQEVVTFFIVLLVHSYRLVNVNVKLCI